MHLSSFPSTFLQCFYWKFDSKMCIFNGKYVLQCVDFDDEFQNFPDPQMADPSPAAIRTTLGPCGPSFVQSSPTSNPGYALALPIGL